MSFYGRNRAFKDDKRLDGVWPFFLGIISFFVVINAIPFFFGFGGTESTLSSIIDQGSDDGKIEIDGAGGFDSGGLNYESISLKNVDNKKINLDKWVVKNKDGNSYTIKNIKLIPDRIITLYSRSGEDHKVGWVDNYYLYWDSDTEIWDNDGDTIYLYNSHGRLVDSYTGVASIPTTSRSGSLKSTKYHGDKWDRYYEEDWAEDRMAAHAFLVP